MVSNAYPYCAPIGDVPTLPFNTRSQEILPCASERTPCPVGSLQVPEGSVVLAGCTKHEPGVFTPPAPMLGAMGTHAKILTFGIGIPLPSTMMAWNAPGIMVPAWPVKVSPGCGAVN